jgi:biopolymer transport protein TolR
MSMTFGSRGRASSEINVTPMIDMLLVLLIIFMVLFPYQSKGERAAIPQPATDQFITAPASPVVIQLKQTTDDQRPKLKINEQEVSWENFSARLEQIYSLRVDKVAFLKGDSEIDFQYVADAIDVAHRSGVDRVALMTK